MKPPYEITPKILKYITSISEKIGAVNANYLDKPSPQLRKRNQIKTIHSSLKIEGNVLTEDQVTDIIDHKRVLGPERDILEVKNAINVYNKIRTFKPNSLQSFLDAHRLLMHNLMDDPGKLRTSGVGVFKGYEISHLAPPAQNVAYLMEDLFNYLKESDDPELLKSSVFHYEVEFIHPFLDGNGRMGRLWQSVILMERYPVFEFIPFEELIMKTQADYYNALETCDKNGNSTRFIEYILKIIEQSLNELLRFRNKIMTESDRLEYFTSLGKNEFTRIDYMNVFKDISASTASRDLKRGVEDKMFAKIGDKNKTRYRIIT